MGRSKLLVARCCSLLLDVASSEPTSLIIPICLLSGVLMADAILLIYTSLILIVLSLSGIALSRIIDHIVLAGLNNKNIIFYVTNIIPPVVLLLESSIVPGLSQVHRWF